MTTEKPGARTERVLEQGKALVRAIEALATINPTAASERAIASLLLRVYKRRLRGIVVVARWVAEEILSASQHIDGVAWSGRQQQQCEKATVALPGPPTEHLHVPSSLTVRRMRSWPRAGGLTIIAQSSE
jgi:hypothetical protein